MDIIKQILQGGYNDPESGEPIAVPVKQVLIEAGIASNVKDLVAGLDLGNKFTVVSDVNTHSTLASKIEKALGPVASVILADGAEADIENVNKIVAESALCDTIIAVGSGTINDICKYASYLSGKPYIVFGTAPSMNGYSSANASITIDGHKKTLKAHLPSAIFLDLDILCAAPKRLIRSGLGDSLCSSTAQADWLLSHLLLGTTYNKVPFDLLREYEEKLFKASAGLVSGDRDAIELLAKTLIISGFGMYICGGSYPASQGEHLIAHTMEVVCGNMPKTYHGEQIGVTTLTMARMQESLLNAPFELKWVAQSACNSQIREFFGDEIGRHCIEEYTKKSLTKEKTDEINHYIETNWSAIEGQLRRVMVPAEHLKSVLLEAGAPLTPQDLGWDGYKYEASAIHAKYMRDRFTFLDL